MLTDLGMELVDSFVQDLPPDLVSAPLDDSSLETVVGLVWGRLSAKLRLLCQRPLTSKMLLLSDN